jgi:hypothetical protein
MGNNKQVYFFNYKDVLNNQINNFKNNVDNYTVDNTVPLSNHRIQVLKNSHNFPSHSVNNEGQVLQPNISEFNRFDSLKFSEMKGRENSLIIMDNENRFNLSWNHSQILQKNNDEDQINLNKNSFRIMNYIK